MNHDGGADAIIPVEIVTTWPEGSFAESVAIDADGQIFVSLHTDRAVVRVDPTSGAVLAFAEFDRPATGLAFARDGALIVSGGAPGERPGVIWRIERDGTKRKLTEIADAAFLNGVTPLGERMLVAESSSATIYAFDPVHGGVEVWLRSPLLGAPEPPGANGVKLFDGAAIVSVTGADRLLRVPIQGCEAGAPEILAENLRADDFAIGADGALYIATHPAESLLRFGPDGARTTLAKAEHGMIGSTAVAFGRRESDRTCIYVTTTGGTWTVPKERMEKAKLLRLGVGQPGHPLLSPTG